MGTNPGITVNNPQKGENSVASATGPVLGSQIVPIPQNNFSQPIAMPIYVGSTPAIPGQRQLSSPTNGTGLPVPTVNQLPTPPWMMFQQNVVRLPQAVRPTVIPAQRTQPPAEAFPSMGTTATQVPPAPVAPTEPQQDQAAPTQIPPTNLNPPQQPENAPQPQPEQEQPQPPDAQQGKKKPEEAGESSQSKIQSMEDDALNQDTIRSLNSRLNNSVQSVRVAAAGDFLTLMVANPDLSQNPRYHDIVDAFLEKMLKDPSGDVRAAVYRSFESANITEVSQGVYDLLKQRSENDGIFGVETDSINAILASVKVKPENKKEAHQEAKQQRKAEKAQEQEKQQKKAAHTS